MPQKAQSITLRSEDQQCLVNTGMDWPPEEVSTHDKKNQTQYFLPYVDVMLKPVQKGTIDPGRRAAACLVSTCRRSRLVPEVQAALRLPLPSTLTLR